MTAFSGCGDSRTGSSSRLFLGEIIRQFRGVRAEDHGRPLKGPHGKTSSVSHGWDITSIQLHFTFQYSLLPALVPRFG